MCCGTDGKCHCHILKHVVMVILAAVLIIYVGLLSWNAWKSHDYIGKSPDSINQITVTGTAKISATPDVAALYIGIVSEGVSVNDSKKGVTEKMNAIIDALKTQFNIDAKDIKSENFSISPKYDYSNGRQNIIGYSVNQSVSVKVRDFSKTGDILTKATELGANTVSGPNFIIDDPEKVKAEARIQAIEQAKSKAKILADQVGIKLGKIVNFYEGGSEMPNMAYGLGGGMGDSLGLAKSVSATIEPGTQDVQLTVSISYEIK